MPPRLGILLSGGGSTYRNLAEAIAAGHLAAEVAVVISSRADAGGLAIARQLGHEHLVAVTGDSTTAALVAHRADHVAMCGYLRYWDPPPGFALRTLNIHPSL